MMMGRRVGKEVRVVRLSRVAGLRPFCGWSILPTYSPGEMQCDIGDLWTLQDRSVSFLLVHRCVPVPYGIRTYPLR